MLNLDTHILLLALNGELSAKEEKILSNQPWGISSIVLWELAKLSQLGRIDLNLESSDFIQAISKLQIWPLDLEVCWEIPHLDFRSDPADEIIAATSIAHEVPLLTRDKNIRKSKKVPFAF